MGVPPSADMDGVSLRPVLDDPGARLHPGISLSELDLGGGRFSRAVRTPGAKLIEARSSGVEARLLFDLAEDPLEKHDLFEMRPLLAHQLSEALEGLQSYARSKARGGFDTVEIGGSTRERLEALGSLR